MNVEELAAQRCADEWNESELSLQYKWKPTNFIESARSQRVQYRLLVERIHHAIEAYEAGDKTALEPFKLKPPVDPLVEVVAEAGPWREANRWTTDDLAQRIRDGLTKRGIQLVEIGRAERG